MNAQNQWVADQIDAVGVACEKLKSLGITVLEIRIGDKSRPVIEVQHSRACALLESGLYMAITRGGNRLNTRIATFCGCQVRWQQRAA